MSNKSNRRLKLFLGLMIIVFTILFCKRFVKVKEMTKEEKLKNLINITEKSEEFMNNYFEEVKELNESNNKDNIVIVISEVDLTKENNYGASKVIEAPNNQYILQYDSESKKNDALNKFNDDENIVSAEENIIYRLHEKGNESTYTSTYNSWGIERMRLDKGVDFINSRENTNEVVVAIIDTGLNIELFNSYFNDKIYETNNLYDNSVMYDNDGHGTHIAGTIAEGTPNNVKILPIKVGDNNGLNSVSIIAAINWIVENNKADIINMSYGSPYKSNAEYQAIEAAKSKNIISVAATANNGTVEADFPTNYDNTIGVGSVDKDLIKSNFSNYGEGISFVAPGNRIISINGEMSGTSMAAPHIVSAISILKSLNKNLTFNQTIDKLREASLDLGSDGWDILYGYGFVNFDKIEFCDGKACDEEKVYIKTHSNEDIVKIEVPEKFTSGNYNYGNETNLMNMKIHIYTDNNNYYVKYLADLDNLQIINYNPYLYEEQNIIIKYRDFSTETIVDNSNSTHLGYEYTKDDNNLILTKFNYDLNNIPKKIFLIDSIENRDVTIIGSGLFKGIPIESIVFPNTIKVIQSYAFQNTSNLINIQLSNNLNNISTKAFEDSSITSITIPQSVVGIADDAFNRTSKLDFITVDDNNTKYDSRNNSNAIIESATNKLIAVTNNTNVIPNQVEIISPHVYENKNITEITIPNSVKNIGECAFCNCRYLEKVLINADIDEIPKYSFENDINLKNINLPSSIKRIDYKAFSHTFSLDKIDLNDGLEEIVKSAFEYNKSLKNLEIPNSVKKIGDYAFINSSSLETLILHEGLEEIGVSAFGITMGADGTKIKNIIIPSTVKKIGDSAFQGSKYIINITFNEGLEEIGKDAFEGNSAKSIMLPSTLKSIGDYAFYGGKLENLFISKNISFIGYESFAYNYLESITVDKENEYYEGNDNLNSIVEKSTKKLILSTNGSIPNDVKSIASGAITFNQYSIAPEEILIPEGVDKLEDFSIILYYPKIKTKRILLPKSLIDINPHSVSITYPKNELSLWVYDDTPAKEYAVNSGFNYHLISGKQMLSVQVSDKEYDGTKNIDEENITVGHLDSKDYEIISATTNSINVGKTNAKVKVRLSDEAFQKYTLDNDEQEGEFEIQMNIIPRNITLKVKNAEIDYGDNYEIEHYFSDDLSNSLRLVFDTIGEIDGETPKIKGKLKSDYNENSNVGEYTIENDNIELVDNNEFKAKNYKLKVESGTLKIKKKDIAGGTITLTEEEYDYTGKQVKPEIKEVKLNDRVVVKNGTNEIVLKENTILKPDDYTITYGKNIEDNGTITITAKEAGNYIGTITLEFDILTVHLFEPDTLELPDNLELKDDEYILGIKESTPLKDLIESESIKYYDNDTLITDLSIISKTGIKVTVGNDEYYLVVNGDVSGDGLIKSNDLLKVRQHLLNTKLLEGSYYIAGDINKDNKINSADLLRLRQHLLKIKNVI